MRRRDFFALLGGAICAPFGAKLLRGKARSPEEPLKWPRGGPEHTAPTVTISGAEWQECRFELGDMDCEATRDYHKACVDMLERESPFAKRLRDA